MLQEQLQELSKSLLQQQENLIREAVSTHFGYVKYETVDELAQHLSFEVSPMGYKTLLLDGMPLIRFSPLSVISQQSNNGKMVTLFCEMKVDWVRREF